MDRYTVFKKTGTHADVLAAIGAADVLQSLQPCIVELEDRFEIRLRRRMMPSDLMLVDPGFSYLALPNRAAPDSIPFATVADSRAYSTLGRMKAYGGPNQLALCFSQMPRDRWAAKVWDGFLGTSKFVFSPSLVQLFNPQSARGYSLLKPKGTRRHDRSKDRWAEPFTEWLRYRGYFAGSAGWFTAGDLRLFSMIPSNIPYGVLVDTMAAFRDLRLGGTGTKMDCRAILALTRLLVQRAIERRPPNQWIRGLWVTQYKDMGQAHTVMAMDQLALPDWFEMRSSQDEQSWLTTIEEHDVVVRRLVDTHSDEFALLKQYRRTFQSRRQESVTEFLEFVSGYGMLVFRQRSTDEWRLPQFGLRGVVSILEGAPDLSAATKNPGVLAIASAVRGATFGAQAARQAGRLDHREIRYGLLSDIRRAGLLGKHELVTAATALVASFNQESCKLRRTGKSASDILPGELEAFCRCVDGLPSAATAALLICALGACIRRDRAAFDLELFLTQEMSA